MGNGRDPDRTALADQRVVVSGDGEAWLHTLFGAEENLRLRVHGDVVRLEIAPERMGEVLEKREEMIAYLKKLGFSYLTMDLEGFRSGSMDEKITQKEETK